MYEIEVHRFSLYETHDFFHFRKDKDITTNHNIANLRYSKITHGYFYNVRNSRVTHDSSVPKNTKSASIVCL